jgi:PIN domain nuclease of toxin-antitoxin system
VRCGGCDHRVAKAFRLHLWTSKASKLTPNFKQWVSLSYFSDSENIVFVSAASIWEIAIKAALDRLEADPMAIEAVLEPSGFEALPVTTKHAAEVSKLPL